MVSDMTEGKPSKIILMFALPMILGNLFQQLYNIVDSIVVGNFVGAAALAAVGASFPITFLSIAIAVGGSMGCSVVISQMFGAKLLADMKTAIFTSLFTILALAVGVTAIGLIFSKSILLLLGTPADILQDSLIYLNIYFLSVVFLFGYNILTAIFNALGNSKTPLYFLIFSSVVNIVLDLLFVIQFNMGVAGVAWATLISQGMSSVMLLTVLVLKLKSIETEEAYSFFDKNILAKMAKIALPSILQQSVVSLGMLMVQKLVNGYGTIVVAGYTAATKIDTFAIMPMINLSNAMSTFTAQNIGADKKERVAEGYHTSLVILAVVCLVITGSLYLWGDGMMGLFVDSNSSADVIAVGLEYLHVVSLFYIVMGVMFTTNGLLRGAGDVKAFTATTIINISVRIAFAYLMTPIMGVKSVWWSIVAAWFTGLIICYARYRSGAWKNKGVVHKPQTEE